MVAAGDGCCNVAGAAGQCLISYGVLHVGEEGLHVEGRVLDVMLENFAAPARKLDVTCRKSFLLAARNYSYIVYI